MASLRRRRIKKSSTARKMRNSKSRKRSPQQGGRNWRPVLSYLTYFKFMRFFSLRETLPLRQTKDKREQQHQQDVELVSKMVPMTDIEKSATAYFWRDPGAKFCIICGDDQEKHLELMCPYNYLSPATYVPCRARFALWGNYTTTLRYKCSRHKEEEQREPPVHDEANSRRLGFLRCLVRVNNLPKYCQMEPLVALFSRFGPLRMWHVATRKSGTCKGYGCVVFQRHEHADEAIEALNCCDFGDRKLRVDWAYPCLNT
ncbi:hypothetical protein ACP70R_040063 [Stipagrostis hirtigluma subsp. patula]